MKKQQSNKVKRHFGLEICLGKNSHQISREQEKEAIIFDCSM
jgi:hypothetical protein